MDIKVFNFTDAVIFGIELPHIIILDYGKIIKSIRVFFGYPYTSNKNYNNCIYPSLFETYYIADICDTTFFIGRSYIGRRCIHRYFTTALLSELRTKIVKFLEENIITDSYKEDFLFCLKNLYNIFKKVSSEHWAIISPPNLFEIDRLVLGEDVPVYFTFPENICYLENYKHSYVIDPELLFYLHNKKIWKSNLDKTLKVKINQVYELFDPDITTINESKQLSKESLEFLA